MTAVIENDWKKQGFQIFRKGVEPPETDMFLPPPTPPILLAEVKGDLGLNGRIRAAGKEGIRA